MDCATARWNQWEPMEIGTPNALDYRIIFLDEHGREASLWRDVPLFVEGDLLHCVCKTPKGTCASYHVEIAEDDPSFKLSIRKGKLSCYVSPAPWNIGMLPQTWSDPNQENSGPFVGLLNEGQPVDVINISYSDYHVGAVSMVKPLLAFAVINEVHLSWHIVAIDAEDPHCQFINNINDIDEFFPCLLTKVRDWLESCYGQQDERAMILGQVKTTNEEMLNMIYNLHDSWKVFSTIQCEWKRKSNAILNYGKVVWENYTAHDSKATITCIEQLPNSDILYDMAWASSESELLTYCSSDDSDVSFISGQWEMDSFGFSRRGDLVSFLKSRMSSRCSTDGTEEPVEVRRKRSSSCFPLTCLVKKLRDRKSCVWLICGST